MRFTVADTIIARSLSCPGRVAIEVLDGSPPISYGELWPRIETLSQVLSETPHGEHGPMVGMLLPNGIDAALTYAACQRAGTVGVTINGRLTAKEMIAILEDSDCQLLLSGGAYLSIAAEVCAALNIRLINADEIATKEETARPLLGEREVGENPCVVAYSSGTTGTPKGAIYNNDYFSMNNYRWGWEFGLSSEHVILITGPMFHLSFAGFTLAGLSIGTRIRIMPEFSAETALEELSNTCSFAFLVPSMLTMISDLWQQNGCHPAVSARHIISAGAPLPLALAKQAMKIFPSASIAEMYGSTEASFVSYEVKNPETLVAHSVGWPAVGADVALFDENGDRCDTDQAGEIGVKSGVKFSGYLGKPDESDAAWQQGYLMTGDIGIWQTDGRLCVVDRKKDMIISGGENIYTAEVERVLLEHPEISQAAVVGLPDPHWGELVSALLVVAEPSQLTAEDVTNWCRTALAGYKVPRRIEFTDALPCNAMGKVQKFRVREVLTNPLNPMRNSPQ